MEGLSYNSCLSVHCRLGTPHTSMRQEHDVLPLAITVSSSSGLRLPAEESSDADTCLAALDPASLLRRAPVLTRVPRLCTSPPCWGELRCHHVSCGSGPHLSPKEGSDAAMCSVASDLASLLRSAPELPNVTRLSVCHMSQVQKKAPLPSRVAWLTCSQGAHAWQCCSGR
jgi:hypothetical protein